MKLEVNVRKKQVFLFLGLFLIVAGLVVVFAVTPNPGHDANTIGPGTFSGDANSLWAFPGKVGIGISSPTEKLDVAGNVKGQGICIGADCRTSWPGTSAASIKTGGITLETHIVLYPVNLPFTPDRVLIIADRGPDGCQGMLPASLREFKSAGFLGADQKYLWPHLSGSSFVPCRTQPNPNIDDSIIVKIEANKITFSRNYILTGGNTQSVVSYIAFKD